MEILFINRCLHYAINRLWAAAAVGRRDKETNIKETNIKFDTMSIYIINLY